MSFCLELHLQQTEDYEILLSKAGFKEAKKVIESHSPKILYVKPGAKVLGARIIGLPPIPIGIDESKVTITLPYTKPCHGTAVVELPVKKEEIDKVKAIAIK
ncbi:DUF1894 domain-containing protein [Methanobacterium sp. SMA-27]|uniref:DUF1894 domain-containing protein n=1 Tax=Methanobacterium sp. SMA-27 TaxID=1495336 RepID=UPI00064F36D9|nr:DUF1894 domain-containing protein [Methanobacterium sp. SMA-27]